MELTPPTVCGQDCCSSCHSSSRNMNHSAEVSNPLEFYKALTNERHKPLPRASSVQPFSNLKQPASTRSALQHKPVQARRGRWGRAGRVAWPRAAPQSSSRLGSQVAIHLLQGSSLNTCPFVSIRWMSIEQAKQQTDVPIQFPSCIPSPASSNIPLTTPSPGPNNKLAYIK